MVPFLISLIAVLACVGAWWLWEKREDEKQHRLVGRIRKSELYGHLYPELKRFEELPIETVTVRPQALSIRLLEPVGAVRTCTFESLGFDDLEQDSLYALTLALSLDLGLDMREYDLYTRREHLPDGTPWCWYEYCIRSAVKDELLRSMSRERQES